MVGDAHRQSLWHLLVILGDIISSMKRIYPLILILTLVFLPSVIAQNVDVGVYILNLEKFDTATGSFTADFYLSLRCQKECISENFEFMNGRAVSLEKIINKPNEKFYRIQANLNSPVNLQRFPFDKQSMQIIIEDKNHTIDKVRYLPLLKETRI
ncbi:MAG: hypothetical protein AABY14_04800, partial [Nanoarchaeota archaeon]